MINEGVLSPKAGGEDNEFVLDGRGCWIDVDNLTAHLYRTDEGIVVDIFPNPLGDTGESIASTYAFFDEGEPQEHAADCAQRFHGAAECTCHVAGSR